MEGLQLEVLHQRGGPQDQKRRDQDEGPGNSFQAQFHGIGRGAPGSKKDQVLTSQTPLKKLEKQKIEYLSHSEI